MRTRKDARREANRGEAVGQLGKTPVYGRWENQAGIEMEKPSFNFDTGMGNHANGPFLSQDGRQGGNQGNQ